MAEEWRCPTCGTPLVNDMDYARGVDASGNNWPLMACPGCVQTFGLRDDGQIVPVVGIPNDEFR
jgi:hypothetical protein